MLRERILDLCKLNNTTVTSLENELGLGKSAVSKWDVSSPRVATLKKVADYFGVTVDYLLGNETMPSNGLPPELLRLAEQIQSLPPEMRDIIERQVRLYADMDKI